MTIAIVAANAMALLLLKMARLRGKSDNDANAPNELTFAAFAGVSQAAIPGAAAAARPERRVHFGSDHVKVYDPNIRNSSCSAANTTTTNTSSAPSSASKILSEAKPSIKTTQAKKKNQPSAKETNAYIVTIKTALEKRKMNPRKGEKE